MDGTQSYLTPEQEKELMEEMQEEQEEKMEEGQQDQFELNEELAQAYGAPEPEERMNAHTFLHTAVLGSDDTIRTTFLHEGELGRPIFTVRFMLDMNDIAKYYLDPILIQLKMDPRQNGIATYFWEKTQNVTSSGQSNKGFSMNLNVTRRMDSSRKRVRDSNEEVKGGTKV